MRIEGTLPSYKQLRRLKLLQFEFHTYCLSLSPFRLLHFQHFALRSCISNLIFSTHFVRPFLVSVLHHAKGHEGNEGNDGDEEGQEGRSASLAMKAMKAMK